MSDKPTVQFFTQRRYVQGVEVVSEWDYACLGHDTMEDAITCQDYMAAAMLGEKTFFDEDPRNQVISNLVREIQKRHEAEGLRAQLRMISVTSIIDVVEPPQTITKEKIKPKKETS